MLLMSHPLPTAHEVMIAHHKLMDEVVLEDFGVGLCG
jgi:hypothetical protein